MKKRAKSLGPGIDPATWYADALTEKFKGESGFTAKVFTVRPGRVYDRIMQETPDGRNGSVHCFIRKSDGAVLKAAGLHKPADGARYPSVVDALPHADWSGGYLYIK